MAAKTALRDPESIQGHQSVLYLEFQVNPIYTLIVMKTLSVQAWESTESGHFQWEGDLKRDEIANTIQKRTNWSKNDIQARHGGPLGPWGTLALHQSRCFLGR